MERFCEDLGVDPANIVMLVLAWHMNASDMGYFSRPEWIHGLSKLECDSVVKLRSRLGFLQDNLSDPENFKSIYRYAFDFARVSLCLRSQFVTSEFRVCSKQLVIFSRLQI